MIIHEIIQRRYCTKGDILIKERLTVKGILIYKRPFNIIIFSASVIMVGTDLYHYIRFFHYYTWCLYYNIRCFDHHTRCIYPYIRCFYLARARVGPQDKEVITHNGPPTILTVAPMTRRFTKISGPSNQSGPQVFCPPPLPPSLAGLRFYCDTERIHHYIRCFYHYAR